MNPSDTEQALKRSPLFAGLARPDLERITKLARSRVFTEGDVLFRRDDPPGPVYVIKTGRIKIEVSSLDGKETLLAYLSPGDCFGEMGALDELARSADAVAIERTETLYFGKEDFVSIVTGTPSLALELFRQVGRRLRETNQLVAELVFFDVQSRVARRLLELGESFGTRTSEGVEIQIPMTQQDLANMVGATREMVNRAISHYRVAGHILQKANRFILVHPEALEGDL